MVKERAKAKFDETIEIAMNLGVDPRHADQMVRGVVNLPNGSGRTVRVGVFARGAKADEAKAAGADVVGAEDLVEKVNGGKIDFDRCIATPDMMPLVGRLGKVLGPRGLMPNPKVGTVTMDVTNAVKGAKGGSVEFRVEKAGIVQAGVGKASFSADKLVENIKAFADAVQKAKPAGAKGTLHQPRRDLLDHGPGREGRAGARCSAANGRSLTVGKALEQVTVRRADHGTLARPRHVSAASFARPEIEQIARDSASGDVGKARGPSSTGPSVLSKTAGAGSQAGLILQGPAQTGKTGFRLRASAPVTGSNLGPERGRSRVGDRA